LLLGHQRAVRGVAAKVHSQTYSCCCCHHSSFWKRWLPFLFSHWCNLAGIIFYHSTSVMELIQRKMQHLDRQWRL
jgi:hypothetical protein